MRERLQSPGEVIANNLSCGAGLSAALVGAPFPAVTAAASGNTRFGVGARNTLMNLDNRTNEPFCLLHREFQRLRPAKEWGCSYHQGD